MAELVLASTSRYRRELLSRLGLAFTTQAPTCDEAIVQPGEGIDELALRLAIEKAHSVHVARPSSLVVGSDQIVDLEGERLGKPGTLDAARAQLARLAGRTHRLVTAVAVLGPDSTQWLHVDIHQMHMRDLSASEIERYVDADRPEDCAGAYKIESLGISLFEQVRGDDFTAISGLPLVALARYLRSCGLPVP